MCGTTDGACGGDCFLATTEEQIVAVDRGACDGDPLERLGSASACQEAAKALGYAIDWGPSGGFVDVVDGCSVRNDTMLFYNAGGTCSLTRGEGPRPTAGSSGSASAPSTTSACAGGREGPSASRSRGRWSRAWTSCWAS
ncbi:unnamed protein product [Prorocentrum cordatum]|uniref:Subtilisin n=1 Tax=Prorocentrum cordatum TaxID=2364126 RepID=A0ABN9TED5_9DINO|nr:unnamed protein product [Polarella glacialis]